jgi:hypothetical protein
LLGREHETPRVEPDHRLDAFLLLALSVLTKRLDTDLRQRHPPIRLVRLRITQHEPAVELLQRTTHIQRPLVQSTSCQRSPSTSPRRSPIATATAYTAYSRSCRTASRSIRHQAGLPAGALGGGRGGATPAVRHKLRVDRDRIAARRDSKAIGNVAAARKLLTLVFYGLRDGHIRCLSQPRKQAA